MAKMNKELLDNARAMSNKIFEKMRIVEECDALAEQVSKRLLTFVSEYDNTFIDLSKFLNEDQIQTIKNIPMPLKANCTIGKTIVQFIILYTINLFI